MESSDGEAILSGRAPGYVLSWTAYVAPTFAFLLWVGISWLLTWAAWQAALGVLLAALTWYTLRVLQLRSIELYTDVAGVWVFRGIFPWSRGHYGVRWRDVEDAVMFTGLFAWITKSYRVRVGHRFTRGSEIELSHLKNGDEAVTHINQRHQRELQLDMAVVLHDEITRHQRG